MSFECRDIGHVLQAAPRNGVQAQADAREARGRRGAADAGGNGPAEAGFREVRSQWVWVSLEERKE